MNQYPEELKASLITRMLPPNDVSVPELARETGIPKDTLYTWRRHAHRGDAPAQAKPSNGLSSEEKFNVVLETASLNAVELGEYCRRKGLFPQQISAWRGLCMQAQAPLAPQADREKLRHQAKEIKQLEAELRRKEKALAEAAALLVLQKKSAPSGRAPRKKDRPCGAQTSDRLDRCGRCWRRSCVEGL